MSIIYEALKKAEKGINFNSKTTPDTKDKHSKFQYQIYLLYVLVAGIGLLIGNIIFGFLTRAKNPSAKQAITVPKEAAKITQPKPIAAAAPQTTLASAVNIKSKPRVSFSLNGVFFSDNEGYALVNNRIVKEGDLVEGLAVRRITLDGVELQGHDGSTIKLSTNTR